MWCYQCGQDVPGIVSTSSSPATLRTEPDVPDWATATISESSESPARKFRCARCGSELGEGAARAVNEEPGDHDDSLSAELERNLAAAGNADERVKKTYSSPDVAFKNWQWELDQELHDVRHLLEARRLSQQVDEDLWRVPDFEYFRADPARRASPATAPPRTVPVATERRSSPRFAWVALSLSFMAFAGGGVLLGWSMLMNRGDLWNTGLSMALGGQAGLLLGLLLLLERLWRDGRDTTAQLGEVDERLDSLQHANDDAHNHPTPHARYTHSGHRQAASPHMLVSDLKDQLDMLAWRLSDRGR
ncbi:MAG: hypothetical protein DWQ35_12485 [Planctomycetota bacterium]|nr:MAG: hypothetical protein DWQ35_12485 [Planctomycetota bacterium]REK30262.1 MAG: hypothetical protein DWQ42_02520 [Planctomycetota bacterium]REK43454.1 MAG: hypothetical protein DWQ46_11125 [Planctomycetota bacterium]